MEKYTVTGMTCAACSARVEKACRAVKGVENCSVSLLTNTLMVEGNASVDDLKLAVENAGYGFATPSNQKDDSQRLVEETEKSEKKIRTRLFVSLGLLVVLMYISMGHGMWGWPLPAYLTGNHLAQGLLQMVLAALVMCINQKFFINGFKGLFHGASNMDTLVALGSSASFVYSLAVLFLMTDSAYQGSHDLYFEGAAMILVLITVGKMLEANSKGKSTSALKGLMDLSPKTALVLRDGKEITIEARLVQKDDIFILKPGDRIPVDGLVTEGFSSVDEASITGESIPCEKSAGAEITAGTINLSGVLKARALRVGEDTTLNQIIRLVSETSATKAPVAKIADKISGIFVPVVMTLSAVTFVVWLLCGYGISFAVARAVSVLVISCPCALGLATPVAIMVGSGKGAGNGILFKTAESLEQTGKCNIVCLDKTGTITKGQCKVTKVVTEENALSLSKETLISYACSMEKNSTHPLGKAIVDFGKEKGLENFLEVENFVTQSGGGLEGIIDGKEVVLGSEKFLLEKGCVFGESISLSIKEQDASTKVFLAVEKQANLVFHIKDTIKEDSVQAIKEFKNLGIKTFMLTGDNKAAAFSIAEEAGIDGVYAELKPLDKERIIEELSKDAKVLMIGDGINDAPALTKAFMGMAIGSGTDIAMDAAGVVLMKSSLLDAVAAVKLSRATLRNIKQNLFWAFFYNLCGIPLAAGVFYPLFGWKLNPMFGAAAMSLSSFFVVTNALRLNLVKLYKNKADNITLPGENKTNQKESTMEKTMEIKGMMCGHCEARVKKTLEAVPGVTGADVSHEKGTAVVKMDTEVSNEVLTKAVTDQDYEVVSIK